MTFPYFRLSACILAFLTSGLLSAQCYYVPANTTNYDTVTYGFTGGSFQSYGCAPIDPTRWISGSGMSVTMTFTNPEDYPMIRVWGMNDDDVASVTVNGNAYTLNYTTATYLPKVVCGLSPGPDGVYFIGGNLVGSNTNSQGNYSYSDVMLLTTGVNTITVSGLAGAGWGFAGVSVNCQEITTSTTTSTTTTFSIFPNPATSQKNIQIVFNEILNRGTLTISDISGRTLHVFENLSGRSFEFSAGDLSRGLYFITLKNGQSSHSSLLAISAGN